MLLSIISIHALREEGDARAPTLPPTPRNFYPRPPRGRRPRCYRVTPREYSYFYPRPPRGRRQRSCISLVQTAIFLSTPSARKATTSRDVQARHLVISIHALREEGDVVVGGVEMLNTIFLSTPSARKATEWAKNLGIYQEEFLSTPSARKATRISGKFRSNATDFYPRPPRGRRRKRIRRPIRTSDFYPRPPRGRRRCARPTRP